MALSKVTINVGQGGLGRRALNKDKISGLLFFDGSNEYVLRTFDVCCVVF